MLLKVTIRFFVLAVILFSIENVMAQSATFTTGKWGIEADYVGGRFLKHGTSYVPSDLSHGFEVSYFRKTLGEKPWHKGMNFPEIGATFVFFSFADHKIFGDAIAVMASAKFYVVRSRVADFYIKLGSGYGILTRRYSAHDNPVNTLISSPLNMAVQLRLGLDWKINKYVQLNTAIGLSHFSNAGYNLPNYGLNMPTVAIGIRVFPQPRELSYNCEKKKDFKKNEIMWKLSVGIMQLHSFNSVTPVPTRIYPAPCVTVAYARYINPGNKFYGGLSFEYFPAIRDYLMSNDIHTRYGANFDASIPSVILGDEFILGRMSMFYSAGVYLWKNTATITPLYFKVGMNVYVAQIPKHKGIKFFFGNNVKAHTNVAQYNEVSIGGTF